MRLDARLLLVLGLIAGALYAGKKVVGMARAIRNNNPGNIRLSGVVWNGQVPASQQTDDEFVQFSTPEYGIRAMARVLNSYAARGITSLAGIISTWAPPTENDTQAYIAAVSKTLGIDPDQAAHTAIGPSSYPALIAAMIREEAGVQPYSADTLARGIALA